MDQKKTETKEIVEIKDGKVEVTPVEDRVLELTRTYSFGFYSHALVGRDYALRDWYRDILFLLTRPRGA